MTAVMSIPFKTDPLSTQPRALFPRNVFDLLPKGHDGCLFQDLWGQRADHPRKLMGILIYGYSHGVFSSRQLEKRCKEKRLEAIREAKAALEACEAALNPGKPIDDKKQISFADHDARIMGKGKDFDCRYNGQISVDSDHQIIVGQHLSQNANDQREVGEALDAIQSATGGPLPEKMSLDNGYHSGDNLQTLDDAQIDSYVSVGRGESAQPTDDTSGQRLKINFIYDNNADCFDCPDGHQLTFKQTITSGKRPYQAEPSDCANCAYHKRCCRSWSHDNDG